MKDFRLYDIADFVMDEDFIRWVQRKDPIDNLFWENWLEQNPSRHLIIAEARQIVEFIQLEQQPIPAADVQVEIAQLLTTIHQSKKKAEPDGRTEMRLLPASPRRRFGLVILAGAAAAAAVIILLMVNGIPRVTRPNKGLTAMTLAPSASSLIEKDNPSDKPLSFSLPDGTAISLSPGSRISYPNKFATSATRDVYLSGEAYFAIAKNPAKPFRVLTGELITRVLGTTFCIRGFEKDTVIRVTVHTGKVSVSTQSPVEGVPESSPDGLIVSPNQQLVYHREVKKFQKILVEKPSFVVPDTVDHSMVYEDTPVEKVFEQMGRYYGINIVFDNELLSKCTVTADLANEPFYHKLDLICKAIGANYEIVDAQVVIQSNGCQ
ncbi:MAG TPA: FecR domain-containing protein [Puia sp.]|jgi:ferric-dicitrate binding protein FerR (iron transport regulator)